MQTEFPSASALPQKGGAGPNMGAGNSTRVLLCGWQEPNYLSHHLLLPRMCISKKLESGVEPGLKLRCSNTGYSCFNWYLNR